MNENYSKIFHDAFDLSLVELSDEFVIPKKKPNIPDKLWNNIKDKLDE